MLPVSTAQFGTKERDYLLEVMDSEHISGTSPMVERFEQAFAEMAGSHHALACSNGTTALHLALHALDLKPGDQIIVPDLTYVATANAVTYCGATPVFADVEPDSWCISARTIAPLIRERTVAVIAVHLYGMPCDTKELSQLCNDCGLHLIEDAAQAHGGSSNGWKHGEYSQAATYSFYGNKLMTTGEGGMVTTNSHRLYERMRSARGHAMDPGRRYWFLEAGYNYRMPALCAAVGLGQLEGLSARVSAHRALADLYRVLVAKCLRTQAPDHPLLPEHVWWLFNVVLKSHQERETAAKALADAGFETRPVFPCLSDQPWHVPAHTPVAHELSACGLSLPTGPHVTSEHVYQMREVLRKCL